jgi:hypothetical protein
LIRIVTFLLAAAIASASSAQAPRPPTIGPEQAPRPPTIGPGVEQEAVRRDLWKMLTPDQRVQLWRSLSAEQRADIWPGLAPQERREIREQLGPREFSGGRGIGPPTSGESLEGQSRPMMTPGERQKMREQIREAHRLRREQMEQARRGRTQ